MKIKFPEFKVYIGCSLTHAPNDFIKKVEAFKKELESICKVLKFLGLSDDPPRDVYDWDIKKCVMNCDLLVAITDFPSIGLGYELATQTEKRQAPAMAVAHNESLVTDLILDPGLSHYTFHRYTDLITDVIPLVVESLGKISSNKKFD